MVVCFKTRDCRRHNAEPDGAKHSFEFCAYWSVAFNTRCLNETIFASQVFAILAGFGALLPITGYVYGVQSFGGLASFIPMALNTAVTFLILTAGTFFARPAAPLAKLFATEDLRGVMARRLFLWRFCSRFSLDGCASG